MDPLLRDELVRDEGLRLISYQDTVGLWTIGVGHLLGDWRRIVEITHEEAMAFLEMDIQEARQIVHRLVPAAAVQWDGENHQRYRALVNMAFNLGNRLEGFHHFLASINAEDWAVAGRQMMESKWATQVGARAARLRKMIETDST